MYSINEKNNEKKGILIDSDVEVNGFLMGSKDKIYKINGCKIKKIKISNKNLAHPLVSKKVSTLYDRLIFKLTDLLVDDDDSGDTFREALNEIERFRLIIKNKYRAFLTKEELENMSKQLVLLKKEANERLMEIHDSYLEMLNSNNRSK